VKHESSSSLPVRVGVFSTMARADRAVERLLHEGFAKESITVIAPARKRDPQADVQRTAPAGARTPAAAASGGVIGAALGGLIALAGIATTGGLSLLMVGPLIAGAGGGAVAGGFIGAMMTRGFEKEVANFYDQAVESGKVLVSVEDSSADPAPRLGRA
jgi:hypothetical protein